MKRRTGIIWIIALTAAVLCVGSWQMIRDLRQPTLPYHDSFVRNDAGEWVPMGGDWQISRGMVINRSDEHGAKLVTGSSDWKDYELDADLELIGHAGDVGVIVRVGQEEEGVDSYNGYYVGLRSPDSAIVIGRADHGWLEGRPQPMLGGVQTSVWYHLRVVVVGCDIGAQATNIATGQSSSAAFEEKPCVSQGKIGLRSMGTGGAWRDVSVSPASYAQFAAIRAHASSLESPVFPIREDDYSRMREKYFSSTFTPELGYRESESKEHNTASAVPLSIAEAKAASSDGALVHIRGVVTLTSPVYVQDSTAGIAVQLAHPAALNLGDEVEVTGRIGTSQFVPHLIEAEAHLLGNYNLVVPVSVTPTQAADGTFDGRLVELRGTLRNKTASNGEVALEIDDADQRFRAVGRGGLSPRQYNSWERASELRIRGICTVGPWNKPGGGGLTILLRSMDDVEVLAGPPWWSPHLIVRYILVLLALVGIGVYVYLRVERGKMRAILNERERLAHEMHDTLAQSFAGVGFHLQGMCNSLRTGGLTLPVMLEKLDIACAMVTHTHRQATAEIAALHPEAADGTDLLDALERSTHGMLEQVLPLTLLREGVPRPLSLTLRDALFQIGRESIANILRHSSATEIVLTLRYSKREVVLEIRDNGVGFDLDRHSEDFGIRAMRRRGQRAGATLHIDTAPGKGTCVRVQAPYGRRAGLYEWMRTHMRLSFSRTSRAR